jgi:hypothetical protein
MQTIIHQTFGIQRTQPRTRLSTHLQLPDSRERRRHLRIAFVPRREACLTKRAMIAALREAEFDEWMASGGDYLASMHQPVT